MAKVHGRHLAGGRAPTVTHERLFRFEFPEKPGRQPAYLSLFSRSASCPLIMFCTLGALHTFLDSLSAGWNVTLFHYRNHGADIGRVLVGIQVPDDTQEAFVQFLNELGYVYNEETGNPVYQQF